MSEGDGIPDHVDAPGDTVSEPPASSRGWLWMLLGLAAVVALGTVVGRTFYGERQLREHTFSGPTMGTTWSLKVVLPDGAPAAWVEAFRDTAISRLERIDALMSTWDPDSEVSTLNGAPDCGLRRT